MDLSKSKELRELSQALEPVARQAELLGLRWILIGAAGRDLILKCSALGLAARATRDVDIAVHVASWPAFDELKTALVDHEGASPDPVAKQRITLADGAQLDLVPFGGIEENGRIEWPPELEPKLNVRGLIEAERHSLTVLLPGGVQVRVPKAEAFICLKLFAWRDRHDHKPHHDSVDLADLFNGSDDLVGLDVMYSEHLPTLEKNDHELDLASMEVLGMRLRGDLLAESRRALITLLARETNEEGNLALVRELGGGQRSLRRLCALLRGLEL